MLFAKKNDFTLCSLKSWGIGNQQIRALLMGMLNHLGSTDFLRRQYDQGCLGKLQYHLHCKSPLAAQLELGQVWGQVMEKVSEQEQHLPTGPFLFPEW